MSKSIRLFGVFYLLLFISNAQNVSNCDQILSKLQLYHEKLDKINTKDPEYIPLHFFLVQDIEQEIKTFYDSITTKKITCIDISYYDIISKYDNLAFRTRNLKDSLTFLKRKVDTLFYEKALLELQKENPEEALYFVNRATQYNRLNPDASILKLNLIFAKKEFEECVPLLQYIYTEVPLQRKHEILLSDFTLQFYDTLFYIGNSLLHKEKESEALLIFKILENFCKNMPANYCNDDYYKGIIRSKTGVYESYLKIAKEAFNRKYYDIALHFVEYAQEYADENENQISSNNVELQKFKDEIIVSLNQDITTFSEDLVIEQTEKKSCDSLFKEVINSIFLKDYDQAISSLWQMNDCPCQEYLDILIKEIERIKNIK